MLLLIFCFLLQLFSVPAKESLKRFELHGKAQGTTYSIIYYAADSIFTKGSCDSTLASLDSSLSIYKPYSRINAFNKARRKYIADAHLLTVMHKGKLISKQTGGAFDMTVMPLVQAWGFGAKQHTNPPDTAQIKALQKCTGDKKIKLRGHTIIKKKPCVQADVNGIAQGYSVDVLAQLLEANGIHNYLVELGGELRAKGLKQPLAEPFTIGIESPEAAENFGAPLQRYLHIKSGALTTSGNYRRFYLSGNKAITHLLDPRTGFPVQNDLITATVWAPDAITADGFDNALMVMGMEKAIEFAEAQKNMEAYFIYKKRDGTVADTATRGFYAFFTDAPK